MNLQFTRDEAEDVLAVPHRLRNILASVVAGCATIKHYETVKEPLAQELTAGVGDVVLRIDCERDLENPVAEPDDKHPPRITQDPEIMCGVPCFAGSRLPIETLTACVDAGTSWQRIVHSWPWLTDEHLAAARAWLAQG